MKPLKPANIPAPARLRPLGIDAQLVQAYAHMKDRGEPDTGRGNVVYYSIFRAHEVWPRDPDVAAEHDLIAEVQRQYRGMPDIGAPDAVDG